MRAAEIKRELEAAGVRTSDAFEKEELARRLVEHRLRGASPEGGLHGSGGQAAGPAGPAAAGGAGADSKTADLLARCRAMTVKELRTELGTRGIPWADALEKGELVERLVATLAEEANFCRSGRVTPGKVAQLTGAQLKEELQDGSTPILLDVYATWCGPCQMMAPQFVAAAKRLGRSVRVVKMDSDAEQEMATRLRVGALPTVILFDPNGKEVTRQEGAMMEQQLVRLVHDAFPTLF